jgi:hypothetical protein
VFLTEGAVKVVIPDDRTPGIEKVMDPCVMGSLDFSKLRRDE